MVRAAILVGIFAATASASPRAGKVVRVERASAAISGIPRVCQLQSDPMSGASGVCFGPAPQLGETITLLDKQRVIATVRVGGVSPLGDGSCNENGQWLVNGTTASGQLTWQSTMGVIDLPIDPHVARQVAADHVPGGLSASLEEAVAIDANGDGTPDYVFIGYSCDDSGAQVVGNSLTKCLDVWATGGRRAERLRQDRWRNCY